MRRLLVITLTLAATAVVAVLGTGAGDDEVADGYKVRAIFDNAFSLIEGENVRVSGVNVGQISALDVTDDNRAAVVLEITEEAFQDFRADAQCTIRPQSLIGEKYVECSPTQRRSAGESEAPPLRQVPEGEPGAGQYLLPVERTSKPVDIDLLNNITRLPQRQRLAIILNELGAGLAGRGEDLNETIRRANPALGATNEVLAILAEQNQVLRDLATNSDTVLEPLARDRERVASFIENANSVSRATAERRADLERNFELLPRFLSELRPTMQRLGSFSDEFQPVLRDLQAAAPDINRLFRELGPFSQASIPAVESLGQALDVGRPALVRSKPIIDDLRRLTGEATPLAENLAALTTSLRDTGGIERFMDFIFYQATAVNGFDQFGHYLRAGLIVNTCSQYTNEPQPGCSSRYAQSENRVNEARAAMNPANIRRVFQAGEDRSAAARRPQARTAAKATPRAQKPLKLPDAVLPGEDTAPSRQDPQQPAPQQPGTAPQGGTQRSAQPAGGTTPAQQGLLDYLLGDG
jgi:virulence factor Mce-like protein